MLLLVRLAAALGMLLVAWPACAEPVAITFDDLPTMALTDEAAYAKTTTDTLVAGLRRHHLPATGFVIGEHLEGGGSGEQRARIATWLDAGFPLGNHTYAHDSLTKTPVAAYIADVAHADRLIRPLLTARGRSLRWFRHPYLETGPTLAARQTFETWLSAHGYRVAPVSMENSDWMFALPYDEKILAHDAEGAAKIQKQYLDYTARAIAWYRLAGFQLLDRRPAYVLLLHATRLNADSIDQISSLLSENGLKPVSLDQAMRDPAYKIADTYAGPDGDEWLSRWSRTLKKPLPWSSFPQPPADIAAANERLDTNP